MCICLHLQTAKVTENYNSKLFKAPNFDIVHRNLFMLDLIVWSMESKEILSWPDYYLWAESFTAEQL